MKCEALFTNHLKLDRNLNSIKIDKKIDIHRRLGQMCVATYMTNCKERPQNLHHTAGDMFERKAVAAQLPTFSSQTILPTGLGALLSSWKQK